MNKEEFIKKWKPWINPFKYTTGDFESDLQLYADEQSREILTILEGAKLNYNGGHHNEKTNAAFKQGIGTAINCVAAYIKNKWMDSQNVANYISGKSKQQEGER